MRATATLALAPLLTLLSFGIQEDDTKTVSPTRQDYVDTIPVDGRFLPADCEEVAIWPAAYGGELLFLEVVPHGTYVNAGDVIARFDTKSIDEQIESAERDLVSTEIGHESTVVRAEISAQAAQAQLEDAVLALEQANKSLEGWQKYELPFRARSDEMSRQSYQYSIDDQEDELAQLEAMYADDELVDAVEEIVLQRSRRGLASSRAGQKLSLDRMKYAVEYEVAQTGRRRLRAVETQEGAIDRLVRSQELDRTAQRDGIARSEAGLAKKRTLLDDLRHDRDLLIVHAPRAGVVLHGGEADYLPGRQRPVHQRAGRGGFRTPLFCVANPDRLGVALSVSESQLPKVREGMPVKVKSLVTGDTTMVGSLSIDRYPSAASAHGAEGSFEGRVALEGKTRGIVVGMRAKLELVAATLDDVLMLPVAAVFKTDEGAHCWAASAGTDEFVKVPLSLGPEDGSSVVVYGALDEHAKVLLEEPGK